MVDKNKTIYFSVKKLFPLIILVTTIFMSVGYAAVNSVIMNFKGEGVAKLYSGIYITDVNYSSSVDANLNNTKMISAENNILNSNVELSKTNGNSFYTYTIKIYNSNSSDYYFDKVDYLIGNDTYSNSNIIFELNGLKNNQKISSKSYVTFTITFKYKDGVVASNNILRSILNFKFRNFQCPEDGRICDLSGNGNHGTMYNGVVRSIADSTVYMDGTDDFISCGLANYTFSGVSYILRFKFHSFREDYTEFFGNWQGAGGGLRLNDAKDFTTSININNNYVVPTTNLVAVLNKWYTMVVTYDGNNIKIYVDGVKIHTQNNPGTLTTSSLPILIGGNPEPNNGSQFNANFTVDYAVLFNRAVSENEAANDYLEQAIISNNKNLVLYYEF